MKFLFLKALSIQAHPAKEHAEQLHAEMPQVYKVHLQLLHTTVFIVSLFQYIMLPKALQF